MGREGRSTVRPYAFLALGLLIGLGSWTFLLVRRPDLPAGFFPRAWVLFLLFSLLIKGLGSRVVPRQTHSLVGIVDLAAILLFGPLGGAWVAASGSLLFQIARAAMEALRSRRGGPFPSPVILAGNILFDSGLKALMALAGGWLYLQVGGGVPHPPLQASIAWPALVLFMVWFLLDHLGWGAVEAVLGGWVAVREWFAAVHVPSFLIELIPLPQSLLVAVFYQQKDPLAFALLAGALIGTSIAIHLLVTFALQQRRSVRELQVLNQIARAVATAELSVERLCELIYEQASHIVDTSTFHLGLFDGDRFTLQVWVRQGVRQDPLTVALPSGEGIIGWMRQSKQPLLVRDFSREMDRLPARPRYLNEDPPRSAVFVPLIASGEVIGSLSIQSSRPATFSEQHLRTLSFIADQAAIAIEKARLYQAARERAAELERIAADSARLYSQVREERDRLELLYNVTRDLTQRLDLDDLLQRLVQRTVESFHAQDGAILLLGTRREPPRAISTEPQSQANLTAILERGLAGWVIQQRQPALVPDTRQDPRWLPTEREIGSAIAVPILHRETVLGAITLIHSQPGFFSSADPTLLMAMAEQSAVALEAARLYEAQRRWAIQLETVPQVMRSILSILDLDDLLGELVNLVREQFGYSHAHIFTLDPSGEEAIFRASTDPDSPFWEARGRRVSLGEGLVGWVAQHGEPTMVGDVYQDPRWLPDQTDVRSEVAVPLKVAGEVVGVLDVQSGEADAFDEEDEFILNTLADQIAVALETARLYAAEQEEAWVLNALLQVAQNVAQARDLDEMLEVVVRLVPLLVGVEHCALFLREREGQAFVPMHGYGSHWETLKGMRFDPHDVPAFEQAVGQAGPVAIVGSADPGEVPPSLREGLGGGSIWLFPLIAGGEVPSILALGLGRAGTHLTSRQQTILAGITNQAGIAIEEARLRREAAERQRLEQELAVAREIQRRLLPECCPDFPGWSLGVSWEAARQVGGDFYDFIQLPHGRLGIVIADVLDKGVPAALFMVLSRSLVRASAVSHASPAEALRRVNRLLIEDTRAEMFVSVFYGVIDLETGEMRYASAGHNPPLLVRQDGQAQSLEAPGIILGVIEDAPLKERSVQLEVGDTLVLYTDGVTETINLAEEEFGVERLAQVIAAHRSEEVGEIQRQVLAALKEFDQGQPPFDDLTLMVVRRQVPSS